MKSMLPSQAAIEAREEAGGHVRGPGHGSVTGEAKGSLCKMTFGWTPERRDRPAIQRSGGRAEGAASAKALSGMFQARPRRTRRLVWPA